jgi:hypothetical protein
VSSNDALPRVHDSSIDGAQASQTSGATATETATEAAQPPRALESESAAALLALAERVVRWEDDVSAAELAVYTKLYQQVLERARQQLALPDAPEPEAPPVPTVPTTTTTTTAEARTALLRCRVEANQLVRRVVQAQPKPQRALSKPRWQLVLLGAALLLGVSAFIARDALVDGFDIGNISRGKPWRASTTYNGSYAGAGTLGNFTEPFFFHTAQEASPWIEVDLGAELHVGSLLVRNRSDCCANRTVPLVVETSNDHEAWQVVATRQRNFSTWRPRVDTNARWIRLRVLRESLLHLRAVIIRS